LEPCHGRGHPLRPAAAHARGADHRRRFTPGPPRSHPDRERRRGLPGPDRPGHRGRTRPSGRARAWTAPPGASGRRERRMNTHTTLATAGRVLAQIRHDPRTVALLLVVPSLLIGLVAWIFTETNVFASIGPAIIALFPFIVMFLVASISTLRERRSGTLERLLTMPLGKGSFVLGYALAFGLLSILQTAIAVAFAVWVC